MKITIYSKVISFTVVLIMIISIMPLVGINSAAEFSATAMIDIGTKHILTLKSDGTILAWGSNDSGQLGDGTTEFYRYTPVKVKNIIDVTAVSAGYEHSLALKDGIVWAWGANYYGQIGDGTDDNKKTPVRVKDLTSITDISAGYSHALALKNDGTVWAWGNNYNGQLGDGTYDNKNIPVEVEGLTDIIAVFAEEEHSMALKNDGTVWIWGTAVNTLFGYAAEVEKNTPLMIENFTDITDISIGWGHTLALKSDGTVWAWGDNSFGKLGDGTEDERHDTPVQVENLTNATSISTGYGHSLALKSDGTVWAWGENFCGQIGDGTRNKKTIPVQIKDFTGVTSISAGEYYSLALKFDGTVWSWGENVYGQLGSGTLINRSVPGRVAGENGKGYLKLFTPEEIYKVAIKLNRTNAVYNNKLVPINAEGSMPMMEGGRTIVPIRFISESLGANVNWIDNGHKITVTKGNTVLKMSIGSNDITKIVTKNGKETETKLKINEKFNALDVPRLVKGRSVLPLRIIGENLGFSVHWDDKTHIIIISAKELSEIERVNDIAEAKKLYKIN